MSKVNSKYEVALYKMKKEQTLQLEISLCQVHLLH